VLNTILLNLIGMNKYINENENEFLALRSVARGAFGQFPGINCLGPAALWLPSWFPWTL
jgi:hypothetical protein